MSTVHHHTHHYYGKHEEDNSEDVEIEQDQVSFLQFLIKILGIGLMLLGLGFSIFFLKDKAARYSFTETPRATVQTVEVPDKTKKKVKKQKTEAQLIEEQNKAINQERENFFRR